MDEVVELEPSEKALVENEYGRAFNENVASILPLRQHASDRRLFRVRSQNRSAIAVFNNSRTENDTFHYLTNHFSNLGLPVARIYSYLPSQGFFLQADLGNSTLLDRLIESRTETDLFPQTIEALYKVALEHLASFQVLAARTLDFSRCIVNKVSSEKMFEGDLVAFKEQFLSRTSVGSDLHSMDDECQQLCNIVKSVQSSFFLYRDFQSRNIMVNGQDLTFIDYQGGMRGPLHYDVVSLLYQASARIPERNRGILVTHYIESVSQHVELDREQFLEELKAFIALRMVQVLGVYGKQGLGAGKAYFRESIPLALATLSSIVTSPNFPIEMPNFASLLDQLRHEFSDSSG